ncbi:MAG: YchF/TatD family DNA exonuclease [Candidatus Aureabacteria bacterium]|nr:YchF/TatD family DNA exonuclease [Candidatus Auribacterota bacterium]
MYFDSHCHLAFEEFESDIDDVLKRASEKNIRIITSGDSPEGSRKVISLVKEKRKTHPHLYATAGFHPYGADLFSPSLIDDYSKMLKDDVVVGLGEVGLDYYRKNAAPENQRSAFRRFLELSVREDVPLVIHNRNSEEDLIRILEESGRQAFRGVIHCFSSGNRDHARAFLKKGFMISFAGQVTFTKADNVRDAVLSIPLNSLLIETDAPYLAPQEKRGKRNEPSYVVYTAEKIAKLRGFFKEDIGRITHLNALKLFRIEDKDAFSPRAVYRVRDSLYINLTNRCPNRCAFCMKQKDHLVLGYNLKLEKEPDADDIIKGVEKEKGFREIVFCGLGEPSCRLDVLKKLGKHFKEKGHMVRLNTNGLGSLINRRNIVSELKDAVDAVSVSLNAHDNSTYIRLCCPEYGERSFEAVLDFIREASMIMPTKVTVVDNAQVNVEKCRKILENLNVSFRVREEYYKEI